MTAPSARPSKSRAVREWLRNVLARSAGPAPRPGPRLAGLEDRVNPTPFLAADINTRPTTDASFPDNLARFGNAVYFGAADAVHGVELWKTDGTAAGTVLVKDLVPGIASSTPDFLTPMNGTLYFEAGGGVWKTDGTPAGTVLLRAFNPAPGLRPRSLTAVGNTLFFMVGTGLSETDLWKTDGTAAGTVLVKAGMGRAIEGDADELTAVGDTLFFHASDAANGSELWKSDGTAAGTAVVKDVLPGTLSSSPNDLTNLNGVLYFTAYDVVAGRELWMSDGTTAGTVRVTDLLPGGGGAWPRDLTNVGGTLYFGATDGVTGRELWKSDGTAAGTVLVRDMRAGSGNSDPGPVTDLNGTLFFWANDGTTGRELWKTDGTAAGTVLMKDVRPGATGSSGSPLVAMGGAVYFRGDDGSTGDELWKTDGTAAGTVLVKDVRPGGSSSGLNDFIALDGKLLFTARFQGTEEELWASDGTAAGTAVVKDIWSGTAGSFPRHAAALNGNLFFSAFAWHEPAAAFREFVWTSDGTFAGTRTFHEVTPGPQFLNGLPRWATFNGLLYYTANDGVNGEELWRTDGTAAGTALVKDINPGAGSSTVWDLIVVNNTLFFSAVTAADGRELWKSDGTAAGTVRVKDVRPGTGSAISGERALAAVNNTVFFAATNGTTGVELWKSDGTEAGTVLVKDVRPGTAAGNPTGLTAVAGTLFFAAAGDANGPELWTSDGTEAGTVLVKDIAATGSSDPRYLTNVGGTLLFAATDGATGRELWKSDGTEAGTVLVKDINPGAAGSVPDTPVLLNGKLLFRADDGTHGAELWTSDGTAAGTVLVKDVRPGLTASNPKYPLLVGGTVFFQANDGVSGEELWQSDGTGSGTVAVGDVVPGSGGSAPVPLAAAGPLVFFRATTEAEGAELWAFDTSPRPRVEFTVAGQSAAEGAGPMTVTARLSAVHTQPVTVPFTVTGTAAGGQDYTISAGPITIPAGQLTGTATINVLDDALDEADETVVLTMGTPTNALAGAIPVHTATILDDDPAPTVGFQVAAGSAGEATATRTVTVTLSAASGQPVAVPYTVSGTAVSPADYTIAPASPVTFAPGETSKTITLTIVNDGSDEDDETVILTLGTPTNGTLGGTTTYTETTTDDDPAPTVSFAAAAGSASEATTPRTVTVSLSAASGKTVTVPFTVAGTAERPADYTLAPASQLVFAPGESFKTIVLTVVNDTTHETDETVVLTLDAPTNATPGATTTYTETVANDDPIPTVAFAVAGGSAAEDVATRTVTVSLSAASVFPITVPYTVGGSAANPADYTVAPASPLSFAPGETSRSITITVVNDTVFEADETVVLTLGTPTNATLGGTPTYTETIVEDEPAPTVSFGSASGSAAESVPTRTITLDLSGPSAAPITVPYTVGGPAASPADYTIAPASPVTFAPGETSKAITLTVVNDTADETDETVVLTLGTPTNATLGTTTTHTETITDDDAAPVVSFAAAGGSAVEAVTTRTVTVSLSAASGQTVTVPYTVSGSATSPADYSLAPAGPLVFAPGQTSKTITVTVADDPTDEADETVTLTLGTPTNAVLGAVATYTETITDDDAPPTVAFASAGGSASENVATRTITVSLSAASAFPITVPYTVAGSAANPADYTIAPTGPLTFAPGETSQTITITVVNDADHEADETVVLTLGTPTNGTLGGPTTYTETIAEDEPAPAVSFAAAGNSAAEGVATRTVTVSLSGPSTLPIAVPYSVGGTANSPADYTLAPVGPLTFAPGETSRTLTVTVADDAAVEPDETVILTLGAPTNATVGTPGVYVETIVEEIAIVVSPPSATYTTEGGSTVTFTVVLTAVPDTDVVIPVASSAPTEATVSVPQLVFTPATAGVPQTVTVTGVDDATIDLNQMFSILLGPAGSADADFAGLDPADVGLVNVEFLPKGKRSFVDADGDRYTVRLTGPGQVGVIQTGVNGPGPIDRIILSPTTDPAKSKLAVTVRKVKGGDGVVDIGTVTGPGLKGFTAAASDLVGGGAAFTGYLGGLRVRDIENGADVIAGGTPTQKTAVTAADVGAGTTISLGSAISTLKVARFGAGRVDAPSVGTLSVTGNAKRTIPADFAADVRLTGQGVKPTGKALTSLSVGGTVRGSAIEVNGIVGSVKARAFADSSLLLGLDGTMLTGAKLGSFAVSGLKDSADPAFADANVMADQIGKVALKSVGTTRPAEQFGVTAGVSLAGVRVGTPSFLFDAKQPVPQGLNLDQDAALEFVVRVE